MCSAMRGSSSPCISTTLGPPVAVGAVHELQPVVQHVVAAEELAALADRPGRRADVELQLVLDLVDDLEGVARLAVHLVAEGQDRQIAHPADLEELAGLALDALGAVDHHHRRVDRGQRAVGVLGEVRVARRVDEVEPPVPEREGHRGGRDRDAALLLELHEVRARAPRLALGAHLPGHLDGAAVEQELLGQRGLAGVRVRDDREGPAAGDLGRQRGRVGGSVEHGAAYTGAGRRGKGRRKRPPRGRAVPAGGICHRLGTAQPLGSDATGEGGCGRFWSPTARVDVGKTDDRDHPRLGARPAGRRGGTGRRRPAEVGAALAEAPSGGRRGDHRARLDEVRPHRRGAGRPTAGWSSTRPGAITRRAGRGADRRGRRGDRAGPALVVRRGLDPALPQGHRGPQARPQGQGRAAPRRQPGPRRSSGRPSGCAVVLRRASARSRWRGSPSGPPTPTSPSRASAVFDRPQRSYRAAPGAVGSRCSTPFRESAGGGRMDTRDQGQARDRLRGLEGARARLRRGAGGRGRRPRPERARGRGARGDGGGDPRRPTASR